MQVRKTATGALVVLSLDHHQTDDGHPPPKKKRGVFVCLIPLGVEQSWQGDFLSLARNFPWVYYAGVENRKGVEESH